MADQQPREMTPAAGVPDPTRVEGGEEPSTVDAPARWSGSAAVPPPGPRKSRWARRRPRPEQEPAAAGEEEWETTPPVDPWAGQDTPWDAWPLAADLPATQVEPPPPLPPTRIEPPSPTRVEPPSPTRIEQPPASSPPTGAPRPPVEAPRPPAAASPPAGMPPPAMPPSAAGPPAPPPGPTKPPKPPKLSRAERKKRERAVKAAKAANQAAINRLPVQTRPPAPPPWAQRPPQRPLPPPPRRRRRWGRRLFLLSLLGVVCCCGGPFAYFQFPTARQYPVRAALPKSFSDLQRRDDRASARAAERLAEQVRASGADSGDVFTGVYGDGRGKRVTVFGVTGFRFTPGDDVRAQLDRLAVEFGIKDVQSFDLGETGAHERCGVGRADGATVVVCAWADHGSLATVLLTRRSITDSAELVGRLREEVLATG